MENSRRGHARGLSHPLRLALSALVVVAVGACSSGPSSSTAAGSTPSASRDAALLKFAQCMREHGIDMADPDSNGNAQFGGANDPAAQQAAQQACSSLLQGAADSSSAGGGGGDEATYQGLLKFARCMRDHNVDFPDPTLVGGVLHMGLPNSVDPRTPTFAAARDACIHFVPADSPLQP